MGSRVSDILERAEPGRALTVFCEDVGAARPELRAATEDLEYVPTLVALEWESAPALASELDEIRDALARAAGSLWPDWYITAEQRSERKRSPDVALSEVIAELATVDPMPSQAWLKRAWQRCSKQQLPLVPPLTSAEQVRQLARALDPRRLIFAISVRDANAKEARVRGLARAAEWLAHESGAKVVLLLPLTWQNHPELDHVSYQALILPVEVSEPTIPTRYEDEQRGSEPRLKRGDEGAPQVLVGPVVGAPHPASKVETMLHAWLTADPELSGLFEFNRYVTVFGNKRYKPDVLWREGGLVIELDGHEHCSPSNYYYDRDRDYRMYMSGYITLRITNEEVYVSPDSVMEKIRSVVSRLKQREAREAYGLST